MKESGFCDFDNDSISEVNLNVSPRIQNKFESVARAIPITPGFLCASLS